MKWKSLDPDEKVGALAWMMAIAWISAVVWPLFIGAGVVLLFVLALRRWAT